MCFEIYGRRTSAWEIKSIILRPFHLWWVGLHACDISQLNQILNTQVAGRVERRGVSGSEIPLKSLPKYFSHHPYLPLLLGMKLCLFPCQLESPLQVLLAKLECMGEPSTQWQCIKAWMNLKCISQLTQLVKAHLSNSFSFNSQSLHLREVVVISHHISDNRLLIRVVHTDICNPEKSLFSTLLMRPPSRQQEGPGTTGQHQTGLCLHFSYLKVLPSVC